MAVAIVEERQLVKALRWYDGFVVALANPGFLIGSLGYSIGALGGWGAMTLWAISMAIGTLSNWIYSETASMFPEKPGGIALYAHEGWRRYFTLVGPVATFGYWFAWSTVLSIFGIVIGSLIQTRWAPGQTWSWQPFSTAPHIGLPHVIAIVSILAVWLFNIFGIKPAVWVGYVTGAMLMIPLAVFIIVPYFTGDWHSSNLHWSIGGPWGGWKLAIVYLYVMGWSAYGVETCATFAPEYKDTVRDTTLALRSAAIFSLAVYILLPLGITGAIGEKAATADPVSFYVPAFEKIAGSWASGVMVVLLIASLLLSMNTATADGSRALYGIARDDMTVKQLFHLSKFHVPARAMTLDMVLNILLVLLVGNTLSILVAGNLGYVSAHFFALTGFLLLRKDRPKWPRPIRLPSIWVPIAAVLALANLVFIVIGASSSDLTGYGGTKETWIGVGVLAFSIVLFLYRRIVQDKRPVSLREHTPATPDEEEAPAVAGLPAT